MSVFSLLFFFSGEKSCSGPALNPKRTFSLSRGLNFFFFFFNHLETKRERETDRILFRNIAMASNVETAVEPHKTFDTILVLDFG